MKRLIVMLIGLFFAAVSFQNIVWTQTQPAEASKAISPIFPSSTLLSDSRMAVDYK